MKTFNVMFTPVIGRRDDQEFRSYKAAEKFALKKVSEGAKLVFLDTYEGDAGDEDFKDFKQFA